MSERKLRPYVCGSITDGGQITDREEIRRREELFFDAEEQLTAAGFDPINPARTDGSRDDARTWLDFMRLSLVDIAASDGVATLEGHEGSVGAMIEVRLTRDLGLPVANVDTWIALEGKFI